MINQETKRIEIILYHRTYQEGLLEEQTKIPIKDCNLDLTLEEFIKSNFPKYPFPILSILYESKEITKFETIIIDGELRFDVNIYTLKIKDILVEMEYDKLIVYINQDRSIGGPYEFSFNITDIISLVTFVAPLTIYFYKRKIRPYRLKKMTLRETEWNIEEYQKMFLMDTLKEAAWALKTLGYKREGNSMIYKQKVKEKDENEMEDEGVG